MSRQLAGVIAALPLALAACSEQGDRPGGEDYRGGDRIAGADQNAMSVSAEALSERFGLGDADLIIAPTTYRAQGDLSSGSGITVSVIEDSDPGYIRVSGAADPQAVLADPQLGLSYTLSQDRAEAYAGQTVIVTLVVRSPDRIEDGQRPALRAAWVSGQAHSSGWQDMALTGDWQKAVFSYDVPDEAASDPARIVMLPPETGPFELAAVAVRTGMGGVPGESGQR